MLQAWNSVSQQLQAMGLNIGPDRLVRCVLGAAFREGSKGSGAVVIQNQPTVQSIARLLWISTARVPPWVQTGEVSLTKSLVMSPRRSNEVSGLHSRSARYFFPALWCFGQGRKICLCVFCGGLIIFCMLSLGLKQGMRCRMSVGRASIPWVSLGFDHRHEQLLIAKTFFVSLNTFYLPTSVLMGMYSFFSWTHVFCVFSKRLMLEACGPFWLMCTSAAAKGAFWLVC